MKTKDILDSEDTVNEGKTGTYKILRVLSLLPILLWPIIFYGSIFLFDDPSADQNVQYLLFYGLNAYPLYLIINALISSKIYDKLRTLSYLLISWPIALFSLLILFLFM